MIGSVIQDNEESAGPLADREVARLLSVLQNAEFTPSDKHNLAKSASFKQRSLIEIAAAAEQERTVIKKAEQPVESGAEADSAEVENFLEDQPDSVSEAKSIIAGTNEEAQEQTKTTRNFPVVFAKPGCDSIANGDVPGFQKRHETNESQ